MNEAIAASDEAAAPVYAAEDLYYAIQEEEQQSDEVQAAYTALAALVASMQLRWSSRNCRIPVAHRRR